MARGDECKTTSKANYACKNLDVTAPMKKSVLTQACDGKMKQEHKKDYGAWGPIFKDKKTFTNMHLC